MPKTGTVAKREKRPLSVVGITCGIGSMLVGARQAGFNVVGNIEWRGYYHRRDEEGRNTFLENFPGAFMKKRVEDLDDGELELSTGCDLAIGHPECGLYSAMQGCNNYRERKLDEKLKDPGDIPLFLDLIRQLRPRFFVMDDLPKSFLACPMEEYHKRLQDYDLFPEWVSNYHYGNIQRRRIRLFMIGALKSERFVFRPGERDHSKTLADVIGDLPTEPIAGEIFNHDPMDEVAQSSRVIHMDYVGHRANYGDYRRWMQDKREGTVYEYWSPNGGKLKKKPGWYKQRWNKPCAVVDGGSGHTHPLRNLPFTIRERARIQGFPDDFLFYGTKLNEKGEWLHEHNIHVVKQTGKAMPIQFCRYVSDQIRHHIEGRPFKSSGARLEVPNPYVDQSKKWYCLNVGYSDQEKACQRCWMAETCEIRQAGTFGTGGEVGLPEMIQLSVRKPSKTRENTPKLPEFKSRIKGSRPGVGKVMEKLIAAGVPDEEIVVKVREKFPGSAAIKTDVSKVRARLRKEKSDA